MINSSKSVKLCASTGTDRRFDVFSRVIGQHQHGYFCVAPHAGSFNVKRIMFFQVQEEGSNSEENSHRVARTSNQQKAPVISSNSGIP